jgi:benzoate 4-monooxygenase
MDTQRVQAGLRPLDDFMATLLWDKKGNPLCLDFGEIVTEAQNLFNAAGENTEIALTNSFA